MAVCSLVEGFSAGMSLQDLYFFMLLLEAATLSVAFMLDMTMFFEGKGTLIVFDTVRVQHRIARTRARAAPTVQRTRLRERVQRKLKGEWSGRAVVKVEAVKNSEAGKGQSCQTRCHTQVAATRRLQASGIAMPGGIIQKAAYLPALKARIKSRTCSM